MNKIYSEHGLALGTSGMSPLLVSPEKLEKKIKNLKYVEVSVEDDTDLKLRGTLGNLGVILRAQHLELLSMIVDANKFCLGNKNIDILLLPGKVDPRFYIDELEELKSKVKKRGVWIEEDNVSLIKQYEEVIKISYVCVPINPMFYPKEVIDYCKSNDLKIIATDIYGRFYQDQMIDSFTRQFLDEFAMANSDIVITGSRNFETTVSSLLFMDQLAGIEVPVEKESLFTIKKSISAIKLVNPLKKVVFPQVEVMSGVNVVALDKNTTSNPVFPVSYNLGKNGSEVISISAISQSVFSKEIESMSYPKDADITDKTRKAYSRYYSMAILQTVFKPKDWKMTVTIGSDFDTITMERTHLSWLWFVKPISFLIVPDKNTFYLIKLPYKKAKVL